MTSRALFVLLSACGSSDLGTWREPVRIMPLAGDDPSLTGDQRELYFEGADQNLYVMRLTGNAGSPPVAIDALNTPGWEATPEVIANGLAIVFASDRAGDLDLYLATRERRDAAWSSPVRLDSLASSDLEFSGSLSGDGTQLVFARTTNGRDLFLATRPSADDAWSTAVALRDLATPSDDSEPHLSDDALDLVFARDNTLVFAHRDRRDLPFALLDEPAIAGTDPWLSPDRRTLYFMRDGELWVTTR